MNLEPLHNYRKDNLLIPGILLFGGCALGYFLVFPPQKTIVFTIIAGGLFFIGIVNWRAAVLGSLFLIIVEGGIRKWIFPDSHIMIYLGKDILLGGAYISFFCGKIIRQETLFPSHPINLYLGLLLIWGVIEMANPQIPNLLVALFGFKAYFYYFPLLYMVPSLFSSTVALNRFLYSYVLFSVPITILGIYQFFSPMDSPLVTYLGWGEHSRGVQVSMVGSFPRVSGTFSFISGYVSYLFTMSLVIIGLFNSIQKKTGWKIGILFVAFTLIIINILMTGSRWPVFMLCILIMVFLIMANRISFRELQKKLPKIILGLFLIWVVVTVFFDEAGKAFWGRVTSNQDVSRRVADNIVDPLNNLKYSQVLGWGIGSTHQATTFLVNDQPLYSWLPTNDFEGESGRIMLEIGLIGFFLFYLFKIGFIYYLFYLPALIKNLNLKMLAISVFMYHLGFFLTPTVFNVTAGFYFWFFSGFLLLLPRLDASRGGGEVQTG